MNCAKLICTGGLSRKPGQTGFDWLHDDGPNVSDIVFRVTDVHSRWPSQQLSELEVTQLKAESVVKPKPPSQVDLDAWYRERVAGWDKKKKHPSEADD